MFDTGCGGLGWIAVALALLSLLRGRNDCSDNGRPSGGCGCGCR